MKILARAKQVYLSHFAPAFFKLLLAPAMKLNLPGVVRWQVRVLEGFAFRRHSHWLYDALADGGYENLARDMLIEEIPALAAKSSAPTHSSRVFPPPYAPASRDIRALALEKVLGDLEGEGVRPFLCFGVLLGYVREGGFMAHDWDLDIGIFLKENSCKQIHDIFKNLGYRIDNYHPDPWPCRVQVSVPELNVPIDVVFFHPFEGKLQTYAYCYGHRLIRNRKNFGLKRVEFQGIPVWVPEDPEAFLTENYRNWQQKSDYHHYVLTSPLTDFSQPIVEYCLVRTLAHSLYRGQTEIVNALIGIGKTRFPHNQLWKNSSLQGAQ